MDEFTNVEIQIIREAIDRFFGHCHSDLLRSIDAKLTAPRIQGNIFAHSDLFNKQVFASNAAVQFYAARLSNPTSSAYRYKSSLRGIIDSVNDAGEIVHQLNLSFDRDGVTIQRDVDIDEE